MRTALRVFSPKLSSISPGEKCARSSRICTLKSAAPEGRAEELVISARLTLSIDSDPVERELRLAAMAGIEISARRSNEAKTRWARSGISSTSQSGTGDDRTTRERVPFHSAVLPGYSRSDAMVHLAKVSG